MYAITTEKLTKRFAGLAAVDSVSLEIREGELFGLLGPNGAGKTTLLSMLSTMLKPSAGSAAVNGFDVARDAGSVRRSIGIVFQEPSLDSQLTAYENLDLHGRLYGLSAAARRERAEAVLRLVGLWEKRNALVKTFSGGMKRRLEVARGLMHKPKLLFLDEPTLGLDPQTRRQLWDYIKHLNKSERITMILTTHYLEEADFLCDRIAIIDFGRIVALDSPAELKKSLNCEIISLRSSDNSLLKEKIKQLGICVIEEANGFLGLQVKDGEKVIPRIVLAAHRNGVEVESIELHKPTLDDVFLKLTGRKMRDDAAGNSGSYNRYMRPRHW